MARSLIGGLAQVGSGYLTGRTEEARHREQQRRQALYDAMEMAQARSALQTTGLQQQYLGRQIAGYSSPRDLTELEHRLALQRQQTGWDYQEGLRQQGLEAARQFALAQLQGRYGQTPPHAAAPSVPLPQYAAEEPAMLLQAPVRLPPPSSDTMVPRPVALAALAEPAVAAGAPRMTLPRGLEGSPLLQQQQAAGIEVTPWYERSLEELLATYGRAEGAVAYDPAPRSYVPAGALPSARQTRLADIEEEALGLRLQEAGINIDVAWAQLEGAHLTNQRAAALLEVLPQEIAHGEFMRVAEREGAELQLRARELENALAEGINPLKIQELQMAVEVAALKRDEALLRNKAFRDMLASDDRLVRQRAMDMLLGIQYYVSDVTPSKADADKLLEQLRTEQARLYSNRSVSINYSGIPETRESHATVTHVSESARPEGTQAAPERDEAPFGRSLRSHGVESLITW